MRPSDIIATAGYQTLDQDGVRWTSDELLRYVAAAQLQIVHLKPDALSSTQNIQLQTEKNLQTVPENALRLLNVVRNIDDDGFGRTVTQTTLMAMNESYPNWPEDIGSEIKHWMYDPEKDRKKFYVYPKPDSGIEIECVLAIRPAISLALNEVMQLEDQWYNQVVDFVLFRAYSKDADYASMSAKAQQHLDSFYNALGLVYRSNVKANTGAMIRGQGDGEL